jgi:MFS family permease
LKVQGMATAAEHLPRRSKIAGVAPTVFLLGMVSLCNDLASEMIYPLLPVFLTSIGASPTFIGLLEGVAEATASLLKLYSGWIADRIGRKRLLTISGYVFSNIARPMIGFASSGWHVLALRFSDRVGKGLRSAPRDTIIAESTAPTERGRAYGFNRAMDHGGAMLGSLVAFVLLTYAGVSVRTVFLLAALPGVFAIALVIVGIGTVREPASSYEGLAG